MADLNEFELIERLRKRLPSNASVIVGAGDDCAVLSRPGGANDLLLFKTDAVVEGIHFAPGAPAKKVGHKALARCLSDIAANAGTPVSALITLALPPNYDVNYVDEIYEGMAALAERHGVAIAGGETTTNPERILISIAVIGTVPKDKCPLRSGARAGDGIFVTGELGGSIHEKHLDFEPRLAEGRWLAEKFPIHSMIDVSDGLAGDLGQILRASGVGAELLATSIPISRTAKLLARENTSAKPPLVAALTDGEDFELLFTLGSKHAVSLLDAWKKQFPDVRLTCIGKIAAQTGLRIRDQRGIRGISAHGYTHFKQS